VSTPTVPRPKPVADLLLIVAALLVGIVVIGGSLIANDGDITGLIKFGAEDEALEITRHVEELVGREIATVPPLGHDGKFFFLQALDPLYLSPGEHAVLLDRPVYRGQRMLFPLISGAGGLMPAGWLSWSIAFTNLAAIALGTVGTARLARRAGANEWWGLAFALNIGVIFEFDISGAGILAFAAAIWGTLALEEGRDRSAARWFTVAVLSREVMFLYLAGALLLRLSRTRRIPWVIGIPPTIAAGCWAVYLRLRLDAGSGVDQVQEFGGPFVGMAQAFGNWVDNPIDLAVIVALLAIVPLLAVRAIRQPTYLGWGALGFVVLAVFFSRQVWWRFFDISRAISPVITAYLLATFASPDRDTQDGNARNEDDQLSESTDAPGDVVVRV
jgi:hypothetical protein